LAPEDRQVRPFAARKVVLVAVAISLASSLACLLVVRAFLPPHESLWLDLMKWDARWYRMIALHGYSWSPTSTAQQTPNFFPLYPLFERAAHAVTGLPISHIAVFSSIVFQAVSAVLLTLIARDQGASEREALLWLAMFLVSPPVVADIMGYYSALFCVLCFLAIYLVPRGHTWLAAVAMGLASAANPLGVAFAAGLVTWQLMGLVTSRTLSWAALARLTGQALVSVSGLLGYILYLLVAFRDPLAFYQATKGWSVPVAIPTVLGRILSFEPVRGSITSWAAAPYGPAVNFLLDAVVALAVVALIVALVALGGAARNFGFWVLVFAFLLLQALSARWGSEIGAMRILLPVVFGVAAVGPVRRLLTRPPVFVVVTLCLMAMTGFLLQHLATGQWLD
jgi:hypothetical protein